MTWTRRSELFSEYPVDTIYKLLFCCFRDIRARRDLVAAAPAAELRGSTVQCLLEVDAPFHDPLVRPHRDLGEVPVFRHLAHDQDRLVAVQFRESHAGPDADNRVGIPPAHVQPLE